MLSTFGSELGHWLYTKTLNCLYHQEIFFYDGKKTKDLQIILKPYFGYLVSALNAPRMLPLLESQSTVRIQEDIKIQGELERLLEAKRALKENKKNLSPEVYKETLDRLNKFKAKLVRKKPSGTHQSLQVKAVCESLLSIFGKLELGIVVEKAVNPAGIPFGRPRRKLLLVGLTALELFEAYSNLGKKPMLVPPLEWRLLKGGVTGGGYLSNSNNSLTMFLAAKVNVKTEIVWDKAYVWKN